MSGGDDLCALSMCKGTDRDGAASQSAGSSLGSACTQGTQHHAVPGSGKAARNPARIKKASLLALAWKQDIGFREYSIRSTDNMNTVLPFCDHFRVFFFYFPGSSLDEIYIGP